MITFKELLNEGKFLEKKLENHYIENGGRLDRISEYTGGGAYDMNDTLWKTHQDSQMVGKKLWHGDDEIDSLQEQLKSQKTPQDLTLFAGTYHDPRKHKNSESIVHHPAFLSTSLRPSIARTFASSYHKRPDLKGSTRGDHVLRIHVPKGSPGMYVNHASPFNKQHEFILPHGSNLKYIKTEKRMGYHDYNPKRKGESKKGYFSPSKGRKPYFLHHMELLE